MKLSDGYLLLLLLLLFSVSNGFAVPVEDSGNSTVLSVANTNSSETVAPPNPLKNVAEKGLINKDEIRKDDIRSDNGSEGSVGKRKDETLEKLKSKDTDVNRTSDTTAETKISSMQDSHVEECEPSNRCIDEKNKFIACPRIPGEDSLDISLLMHNRGQGSLLVKLLAPDVVNLEQTEVNLQGNEKKEIKVSIRDGANETKIVLHIGDINCSLRLSNMSPFPLKTKPSKMGGHVSFRTRISVVLLLAAVILLLVVAVYMKFRQVHHLGVPKYEKMDMALPLSTGGIKLSDESDGWDNNWGDVWDDDEETPRTPIKSVSTPSSKGLASRRSGKDGWKD